ncbi:MAG TPA: D-2-hydroxyacid dehydrogenase family protein [Hyphomicrobiaceae bacterium]|jgi:phosphoglycerate dehydrogenase-like enzyme|nr:D-2-hydroxyacid dehydrogenase family protein [Hyphomicrobiaceae bacterium]
MARIAILDDYQNAALRVADWSRLQKDHEIVSFRERLPDIDAVAKALADFEIVGIMRERTPFPRALFERLPKLKLLVSTGKRNASVDLAAAKDRNVMVCATGGAGRSTADLAIGLMIALARHLREEFQAMRPGGGWQTTLGMDLEGKTLGIIGLGNLGSKVGRIAQAMGMNLIAWSENLTPEKARERGAERVEKDDLLRRADVITIHSVLSPRTRGLIGTREFGLMKPTAFLINTSRGPIVDEAALIAALREKRIAGYGGDTYDVEPLPSNHPLRAEPRALLTPHLGYVTEETYRDFYTGMVQAIEAWLAGKPINVMS